MNVNKEFLKSAISTHAINPDFKTVLNWIQEQNERVSVMVERIPFDEMTQWLFDPLTGALRHETGRFFSIEGVRVTTNWGDISSWDQPIINQPEVGYLGFIVKKIDGVLHFLLQAKVEPGNVNHVQLSPTIQATRSNFMQIHGGNKPLYLDYFLNAKPPNVLLDQLQSEQGARFLHKRNRNIIINVEEEISIQENFIWLTLRQIKELMQYDNLVNMDTRTVVSGIQYSDFDEDACDLLQYLMSQNYDNSSSAEEFFKSIVSSVGGLNDVNEIIHFLTKIKSSYELFVDRIPLSNVDQWRVSHDQIFREDGKYFKVIGVNVEISNREVRLWQQPMVQPCNPGICAFVCKKINGILHFIVQAKLECGNKDIIEMAPTVQCLTGNYRQKAGQSVPFLDYVLAANGNQIIFDCLQSEEGGRFYREQNRNIVVMADDDFSINLPDNYIWMTLSQLLYFNRFNNYLNIQARSLLAAVRLL
jgi:oxidase EvaA